MRRPQDGNRERCEGCIYNRRLTDDGYSPRYCPYHSNTGKPRGCPPDKCDKKIVDKHRKSKQYKDFTF